MREWIVFAMATALLLTVVDRDAKWRERQVAADLDSFLARGRERAAAEAPPEPAPTAVELGMLTGTWWWAYCVLVVQAIENGTLRRADPAGPAPQKWIFVPQPGGADPGWVGQAGAGIDLWRPVDLTGLPLAEVEDALVARGLLHPSVPATRWQRMIATVPREFEADAPSAPSRLRAVAVAAVGAAALAFLVAEKAWVRASVLAAVFVIWAWGQRRMSAGWLALAKIRQPVPAVTARGADALVRARTAEMVHQREAGARRDPALDVALHGWAALDRVHPALAADLRPPEPAGVEGGMLEPG